MPTLITAVLKPFRVDAVTEALRDAGVSGLTATEVQGYGRQSGKAEEFEGAEYQIDFVPKVRVDVLVPTRRTDEVIRLIADTARAGRFGDGKIWSVQLDEVSRIRTGERDDDAI